MGAPTPSAVLPPPRVPGAAPYRIAVVCLGNICRSPIGQVVLADRVERAGLSDRVEVVSAGTGGWHVGEPMDRRAAAVLAASGYDGSLHRGQQFAEHWYDDCDLVLAMDSDNFATLAEAAPGGEPERLQLFRAFDPLAGEGDRDVADPYYGGDEGFSTVLSTVERTAEAIVAALDHELGDG